MSKFESGMKAFSIIEGVINLIVNEHATTVYPLTSEAGKSSYSRCGRVIITDKFPVLYSLEDARRMGFPVPAEPKVVEFETPVYEVEGFFQCGMFPKAELFEFVGKRVKVRIEEIV